MKVNLLIFLSLGIIFLSCQTQKITQLQPSPLIKKIEHQLDSLLANPEFEALSVGVIVGEEIYSFHKGVLFNQKVPNRKTLYEIASLTKTFTGTLLAQAIQENKVQIDDDIRLYLKKDFPNLAYDGQAITFRHLVTHQSGLPHLFPNKKDLFDNPDWDKLPFKINELQKGFSREAFFEELGRVDLDTIPGANFSYSNVGANLLGYLLEEIYQLSFEELLQQKILKPLKMHNTKISNATIDFEKLAIGQNSNKIKMPFRAKKDMSAEGGIVASTEDMLKYLRFHLDETNETIAIAHQPLWDGKFGDFEAGLFWQINKQGEKPDRIFQNGGAFGTSSWVTLIPEQAIGIFLITNVSGQNIHQKLSVTADKLIAVINSTLTL